MALTDRAAAAKATTTETMIVAAARQLEGERVCFVGIGSPNLACNLAKRTVSPELELVYEAGVFGAVPARLPLSIGDPTLVTGAASVSSMFELFAYYLQAGLIDVAFLSGSQIDKWGNLNTTVIGDYANPKVRLPGSGGACEIAINARKVFILMPQTRRSFVEKLDFVTSPGHLGGKRPAEWVGVGPTIVVTGLGMYEFGDDGVMYLSSLHPGVTVEQVKENTGWDIDFASELQTTHPPTAAELSLIRETLDPDGTYSR